MRNLLILLSASMILLSCMDRLDDAAENFPVAGLWAEVDREGKCDRYFKFESGYIYDYDAKESSVLDGVVNGLEEQDLTLKGCRKYSIDGGVLYVEKVGIGEISIEGNEMIIGTRRFIRIGWFDEEYELIEPANCYIVSEASAYKFKTVKGNSNESVGSVAKVEVLWETFGTDVEPSAGDLVRNVSYKEGYIAFQTADTFKEGNAVIAAKDADDRILWSWHIWLTDQPEGQEYYNGAGTMMDRNLGATSATPGDVGALGLLYQWGRKDPFLGSSSISEAVEAKSTLTWPAVVETSSSVGTVDYVTSHPTTFVTASSSSEDDWHYSSRDNTLWTTSDKTKSIYDPCPAGWRVPDGGSNGVWAKSGFGNTTYDNTNKGLSFSISSPSTTWYPTAGFRNRDGGASGNVGVNGYFWAASPDGFHVYCLGIYSSGIVHPLKCDSGRAYGFSIRCIRDASIENI